MTIQRSVEMIMQCTTTMIEYLPCHIEMTASDFVLIVYRATPDRLMAIPARMDE